MAVQQQTHQVDFIGHVLGSNSVTGGTIPEGSSFINEMLNIFSGSPTVHSCYGSGETECLSRWNDNIPEYVPVPFSLFSLCAKRFTPRRSVECYLGWDRGCTMNVRLLVLGSMLIFSGCTNVTSSVTCITGACPTKKQHLAEITWDPSELDHKVCPDISGSYKDMAILYSQFDFRVNLKLNNEGKYDSYLSQDGIQASYESYKTIPFTPVIQSRKYMDGQRVIPNQTVTWNDQSVFNKKAITSIHQNGLNLVIILMDKNNIEYRKTIVNINQKYIGCDNGALVLRSHSAFSCNNLECGKGSASATEKQFRKLLNGDLQLVEQTRMWEYGPVRGLGGKAKESVKKFVFPAEIKE